MIRALSTACAAAWLIATAPLARAGNKPPIAVLGLEVHDSGGGIDPGATRAARELTTALRQRAKLATGPFEPVEDGDKELIDEKLLNNCDSEAPQCMGQIGTTLSAAWLLYGRIEKASAGYRVRLKLLDVSSRKVVSSTDETLPLAADHREPDVVALARTWYGKLTAFTAGGTLVVNANIDRGTVLLDDEAKGTLASGTLTIPKISDGRHVLAIEAKDYQRYETPITVKNGETLSHTATLVEAAKKPVAPGKDPISVEGTVARRDGRSNLWKPTFYASGAVAAAAGGVVVLTWLEERSKAKQISAQGITQHNCGQGLANPADKSALDAACSWRTGNMVGWIVTGVAGAVALGSFYMAFMRDGDPAESTTAGRGHRKRRELAITPIVTPDGGGATVRIDW
jgi:hypothetical protein